MSAKLIYEVLPKITGEVAPIAKDRKNPQQGYSFRGIDDVYAALNLLLAKHGVTILPELLDSKHEICGQSKSGSNMYRHTIRVRYHLAASDGSEVTADAEGEGMDTGDKSTPKAHSTAYKAMAFQVFCIPTHEKVDSENDSPEVKAEKNGNGEPKLSDEDKARIQKEVCAEFLTRLDGAKDMASLRSIGAAIADARAKELLTVEQTEKELNLAYVKRQKALQTQPKEVKA